MTATMTEFAAVDQGFSLISNRKLLALYTAMAACRKMAENSGKKTGASQSIRGHEAAIVGAAIDLQAGDTAAPTLWPHTALKLVSPLASVATTVSQAASAAMANKDRTRIALLFSSPTQAAQSPWLKALALAADNDLPILFITLNQPDTSGGTSLVSAISLKKKDYYFPSINVDGNDVVAVYRVASEAITHARKGHGPTQIHCLADSSNPLENMRKYLIGKGLDSGEFPA